MEILSSFGDDMHESVLLLLNLSLFAVAQALTSPMHDCICHMYIYHQ